ncbi:MAG: ABC transporter ATP-binding protein, partial [Chloroflexota bacterium]
LLGPSGSGKTTLLRIIAGLEQADAGTLTFAGRDMRAVPIHARGFGLMFQDLALFPHRDVFENVAFGLRMMRLPRAEIETRVKESLALVGLGAFTQRDVNQLSGGEQQRVALARSLAPRPRLLMFDEPLGALDRLLRAQLIADVRAILKRIPSNDPPRALGGGGRTVGMTALYVTHDQDEAMAIADRIAILHDGRIAQIGTPEEVYRQPADEFVARFLDLGAVVRGRWLDDDVVETALGRIAVARWQTADGGPQDERSAVGDHAEVSLLIRPERVRVVKDASADAIEGVVTQCVFQRGAYRVTVEVNGVALRFDATERRSEGEVVRVKVVAERIA